MSLYQKLFEQEKYDRSEKKCRQELSKNPSNLDARCLLVISLLRQGKSTLALDECRRAVKKIEMSDENRAVFFNLAGDACRQSGELEEALKHYVRGDRLEPDNPENLHCRVTVLFKLNRFDECAEVALHMLGCPAVDDERFSKAIYFLSRCSGPMTATELANRYPRTLLNLPNEYYHSAMGNLFEKEGNYKKAFHHFSESAAIRRRKSGYDINSELTSIATALEMFDEIFFELAPLPFNAANPVPVFIVGMPRSGTSLVEQMLGAHSRIEPLGEVNWLSEFTRSESGGFNEYSAPELRELASGEQFCQQVRAAYLAHTRGIEADYTIDKMPGNVQVLWLIHRAFPEALVIHTRREKWPTVWSCFKSNFDEGNNFSESLADCALYYDAVTIAAEKWGALMGDKFIDVQYEEFVSEPEKHINELLNILELAVEEQCYDPSKSSRIVETASRVQVTKPVYKDANSNWLHYADLVKPGNGVEPGSA